MFLKELQIMSKTKILIVDDHLVVLEGVQSAIAHQDDLEVVGQALDGRQAIAMVEEFQPDIVVMDIAMPTLNGVDATLQIKRCHPETKIVIFSMYSDKEYIIDLLKAGVSSYILKKDPLSELIIAIRAVASGGTYFTAVASQVLLTCVRELEDGSEKASEFGSLSLREREVFQLLAEGTSVREIAGVLCVSPKTIETHKYNIMEKLQAETVTDLTKLAIRKGVIKV